MATVEVTEAYTKLRTLAVEHLQEHPHILRTRLLQDLPNATQFKAAVARLTQSKDAEIAQARAEAFEEAAQRAERYAKTMRDAGGYRSGWDAETAEQIATAIRALKETTDGK